VEATTRTLRPGRGLGRVDAQVDRALHLDGLGAGAPQLLERVEQHLGPIRSSGSVMVSSRPGAAGRDRAGQHAEQLGAPARLGERGRPVAAAAQLGAGLVEGGDLRAQPVVAVGQLVEDLDEVLLARGGQRAVLLRGAHLDDRGEAEHGQQHAPPPGPPGAGAA
jgi:hypothetical protein